MSASVYFHINPEVDPIFNLPPFFDLPNILQSPLAPFPGPLASNPELYFCHSAVWFLRLDLSMSLVEDRLGGGGKKKRYLSKLTGPQFLGQRGSLYLSNSSAFIVTTATELQN